MTAVPHTALHAIIVAATETPVPTYGYGAAGALVVALLAFTGRYVVRLERENSRLNEARVVDTRASTQALVSATTAITEITRVSETHSRQLDRLTDQVSLLLAESVRTTPTPRRPRSRT